MRKICRFCKGAGKIFLPGFGSRTCGNCKGTGQEPQTHFDEITESPEALAELLLKFQHNGFMARSEISIVTLPTKQDIIEWLKQKGTE